MKLVEGWRKATIKEVDIRVSAISNRPYVRFTIQTPRDGTFFDYFVFYRSDASFNSFGWARFKQVWEWLRTEPVPSSLDSKIGQTYLRSKLRRKKIWIRLSVREDFGAYKGTMRNEITEYKRVS